MDYDRLVAKHKDAVYRQMIRVCGNHEDAEDALIEALLSAYKALDTLRDENAFRGWLAQIGRRVCLRIRRKDALAPVMQLSDLELKGAPEVPANDIPPEERIVRDELHRCVARAIEELPEIYREVYLLREIKDLPAEEVSKKLGLSIAALKSRLHRARLIVREMLDSDFCAAAAS